MICGPYLSVWKMVQVNTKIPNEAIAPYLGWYPFELSEFQKYAMYAIVHGQHSLSCVPTGSGKTMPAEFAIRFFTERGKRVIYTSPIKALSNQKYYEFSRQFPDISFGILTGDMKVNPDADVLIMTAEILQNKLLCRLHQREYGEFEIDFENDLGCMIHDEIHMINDKDRGHVWENILLSTPSNIPFVMLSATLDQPEKFASWIETIHPQKEVYIASSLQRVVPLHHYGYFVHPPSLHKKLNREESKLLLNEQLFDLMNPTQKFTSNTLDKISKIEKLFCKYNIRIHRNFVLNQLLQEMFQRQMFPAVCFVLSRKTILSCAQDVTTNILPPNTLCSIDRECESILRSKLVNVREFIELQDYQVMLGLLRRGIAIHHSGMIPIFRELVELLFERGHIQLLFATETFSVGLNMPIRSTIFTNMNKFDGDQFRPFHSYEFTQAAGRAGRRGKDTKGNVIHLLNLYRPFSITTFYQMLHGEPPQLTSRFKYSYRLVMANDIGWIAGRSLKKQHVLQKDQMLQNDLNGFGEKLEKMEAHVATLATTMQDYLEYERLGQMKSKKKRRHIQVFEEEHPTIQNDVLIRKRLMKDRQLRNEMEEKKKMELSKMENKFTILRQMLHQYGFLENDSCTRKGKIASSLEEVPSLVLATLYEKLRDLSIRDFLLYLSCFSNFREHESTFESGHHLSPLLEETQEWIERFESFEINHGIVTGEMYCFQGNTLDIMEAWIDATNEKDMGYIYALLHEKNIFVGEWLKLIVKIQHICRQWERICEEIEDVQFLQKLQSASPYLLKSIATTISLYV